MLKTVSALLIAIALSPLAFADGKMSLDFQPWRGRILMDAQRTGNEIKGSVSPSRFTPFIRLKIGKKGQWQGQISEQIASATSKVKKNGKIEISISALPSGFWTYTLSRKANGDMEIYGSGSNGNINSGGLKKNGSELYFYNMGYSHELKLESPGVYRGEVVGGGMNNGPATLRAEGDLDPQVLLQQDPALFVLFYIFPFSR